MAEERQSIGDVDEAESPAEDPRDDPAWRLTSWALPLGAGLSAGLVLYDTVAGGLDTTTGALGTIALAILCAALTRELWRRARSGTWVRVEAHEYLLPLGLLLVVFALLAHGAMVATCAPAGLALLPVAWELVHAPRVERTTRLWPYALPMADQSPDVEPGDDDVVEGIVRDVVAGLPPDIKARLEGWGIEVREELRPRPRDSIVFGMCYSAAHVIAIYRRPHLRHGGRGDRLRESVTYTTLHEIAHALGLDEHGVRRLGWLGTGKSEQQWDETGQP